MWEKHVWYQLSMERRFFVYRHFSWQLLYINKGHLFFITSYFVKVFLWLCNNINESTILFIHFLNWVLIVWWNFQPWHGFNILIWCLAMRCCKISNKLSICFIYQSRMKRKPIETTINICQMASGKREREYFKNLPWWNIFLLVQTGIFW